MYLRRLLPCIATIAMIASAVSVPPSKRDYTYGNMRVLERQGYCVGVSRFAIRNALYLGTTIQQAFTAFIESGYIYGEASIGSWSVSIDSEWWHSAWNTAEAVQTWRDNLDVAPAKLAGAWAEHSMITLENASKDGNAAAAFHMWIWDSAGTIYKEKDRRSTSVEPFGKRGLLAKRRYTDLCLNEKVL